MCDAGHPWVVSSNAARVSFARKKGREEGRGGGCVLMSCMDVVISEEGRAEKAGKNAHDTCRPGSFWLGAEPFLRTGVGGVAK